jgi:hypothetical protein
MQQDAGDRAVERFHATNGQVSGYIGLAVTLGILVLAILPLDAGRPLGVAILAVLGTLLVWVTMLRPAVWVKDRELVLRGMYHTDRVRLGAIDQVVVSQVLAISAGGKRYMSPVVGYTARQKVMAKRRRARGTYVEPTVTDSYQVYVEDRIRQLAQEDRALHGPVDQAARRTWAWPEIAGTAILVVVFLVWLLVL